MPTAENKTPLANMSDSDDSDTIEPRSYQGISKEIMKYKNNPDTAGMFVSGWDDADENVDTVKDPKANPIDHILWAAENGEVETIKEILHSQPGLVHTQDKDGYTPLHRAAYGNHLTAVCYLLSAGAKVTAKTEMGWTPLHSACNWNNYKVAARLLAAGADPTALSDGEQSPMHLSSAISHSKSTLLILFLREDTVHIAHRPNKSGGTPEQLASSHGIYAPLYEMLLPAASYIRSPGFTCNPYMRAQ